MRQLRSDLDSAVATRRQWTLPLQRLRPLLQDERHQQTSGQTQELQSGETDPSSRHHAPIMCGVQSSSRREGLSCNNCLTQITTLWRRFVLSRVHCVLLAVETTLSVADISEQTREGLCVMPAASTRNSTT